MLVALLISQRYVTCRQAAHGFEAVTEIVQMEECSVELLARAGEIEGFPHES